MDYWWVATKEILRLGTPAAKYADCVVKFELTIIWKLTEIRLIFQKLLSSQG